MTNELTAQEAEQVVRAAWKEQDSACLYDGQGVCILQHLGNYFAALAFTVQRQREIEELLGQVRVCEGCVKAWSLPGCDYGGVDPMKRTISTLTAKLAELQTGMKGTR